MEKMPEKLRTKRSAIASKARGPAPNAPIGWAAVHRATVVRTPSRTAPATRRAAPSAAPDQSAGRSRYTAALRANARLASATTRRLRDSGMSAPAVFSPA
jgi:hypothetical protein